ncbi:FmdB-like transcriptional regulator [Citrobacter phage Moon]|uniref:FmdB family regulatory protein n=2 Tax=Moonvirus TaxID=1985329 RepID=A0A2H4YFV3_9CAUD|nr:FmdB-like transcriptional regulator [Citrobacter phage Moon]YP_009618070.1 FmdB-like transcriptional regulator [Citrobacter phage CF1 ERZ-2017]YP_010843891.1 FmdB-like transcriptional regulator [Salmonella phage KM16]AIX11982.1 hypothetical protein CPT_Moon11 [Citrobacter phage Moon]AUE22884.1 FmdB family regulatory protein [Citrobacter phage CF1 ERZ-2017]
MPVYNYKCPCGDTFEKIKKISERDEPMNCTNKDCKFVGFAKRTVAAPKSVHGGFYDNLKSGGSNL